MREFVIRHAGLDRVDRWAALASVERKGGVWENEHGVAVGFMRRLA